MTKSFGAALVKDINTASSANSWAGYYTNTNAPLGDNVTFMAFNDVHGEELYASDGTEQGTLLVKDIFPGRANATPLIFYQKTMLHILLPATATLLYLFIRPMEKRMVYKK